MNDKAVHVSLVAIPDTLLWPLTGFYETMNGIETHPGPGHDVLLVEIVAPTRRPVCANGGLPLPVHRRIESLERTDVIVLPTLFRKPEDWCPGRYPAVVDWLARMHARGALLGSAHAGSLLLAETGLLEGLEATVQRAFSGIFRSHFPGVRLRPDRALAVDGAGGRLVTSGDATAWRELAAYLIARCIGPAVAIRAPGECPTGPWRADAGKPPGVHAATDRSDAVVREVQHWLGEHYAVARPVAAMQRRSGLPSRSFKRRFTAATGQSPMDYVQRQRMEIARHRLVETDLSLEEIAWTVGYRNPVFFRRLFRRLTGLTPGDYRRRFRCPDLARG